MSVEKENLVYQAKIAEEAERFDDMMDFMKKVVELTEGPISVAERNLLSTAYKNAVGNRRGSWRVISAYKNAIEDTDPKKDTICTYCNVIEMELRNICKEIIGILDDNFICTSTDADSKVFYLKMKGDYFRYLAEIEKDKERYDVAKKSRNAYEEAFKIAKTGLSVAHPIRLGLLLNYSVYYYEILKQTKIACDMAQKAFNEALYVLRESNEESEKDSTLILHLMRDNLTLWKAESSNVSHDDAVTDDSIQGNEAVSHKMDTSTTPKKVLAQDADNDATQESDSASLQKESSKETPSKNDSKTSE